MHETIFLSLSLFPTRRPFPDSSSSIRSDLSPGSSGDPGCDSTSLVIYGERRFEFFFFFPSFLLLSSSKKNFYSFVRLFMDGSISTRSKKYEESRINTNAGGRGGDLVEIWDIFIDRRDGLKYRQMCNRWTVTLLFRIERRRDFSDSYSSYY